MVVAGVKDMKLAQIDHERCDEIRAVTYVWIPDDLTVTDLDAFIKTAQELYLKNEEEFKSADKLRDPGYSPNYSLYPPMTVAEINAAHKEKVDAYKIWEEKREASRQTFASLLVEVSNGSIKEFEDFPPEFNMVVNWGHRHGTRIEYGETDVCSKDFNAVD
jgi:hypothetical protein